MDLPLSEVVAALNSIRMSRYGIIAVYCVSIYEWLDTCIYPSRWNSVKVVYCLCRYYQLLLWPLVVFAYAGDHTASTCAKLTQLVSIFLFPMVRDLRASCVMLMRAYAFTGRNLKILVILLAFYAGLVGISILFFCTHVVPLPDTTFQVLGGTGCFPDYIVPNGGTRLLAASAAMDLLSLSIIAIYCLRIHSTRGSLGRVFISQGLGAFAVVLVVHGVALGIYFWPQNFYNGMGLPYILVISNLMACRLILELRRKALPTETEILRQHSHLVDEALAEPDVWMIQH
ncbi:hypothetical protein B0H17DRAFT_1264259 [Mycena rosella]|uniref:Uncharacterized protein n=1 Tax=Mycena rosella TaxID=1033263 RepID=A0AAD7MB34_MYCRO|nr:hypothetical protein B0H17DRAFT_1264259 [Mycena rosella]